jgi:hypothetical protein
MAAGERLAVELDFYAAPKAEWLEEHSGKYVVVQDRNVLGFYASFEDAFRAGVSAFGIKRDFLETGARARAGLFCVLDNPASDPHRHHDIPVLVILAVGGAELAGGLGVL